MKQQKTAPGKRFLFKSRYSRAGSKWARYQTLAAHEALDIDGRNGGMKPNRLKPALKKAAGKTCYLEAEFKWHLGGKCLLQNNKGLRRTSDCDLEFRRQQ
jgi:hypothetical protein